VADLTQWQYSGFRAVSRRTKRTPEVGEELCERIPSYSNTHSAQRLALPRVYCEMERRRIRGPFLSGLIQREQTRILRERFLFSAYVT
jgi:hypothetical protein